MGKTNIKGNKKENIFIRIKNRFAKRGLFENILMVSFFVIFFIYSLSLIYPFLWMINNSFKTNPEYWNDMFGLPTQYQFANYAQAFVKLAVPKSNPLEKANLLEMLFNSVWFTVGGTVLGVMGCTIVGYILSKYKFWGSEFLYAFAIFIMIMPASGSLPASLRLYKNLNILNNPGYILSCVGAFGTPFLILYSFFKNISWSYSEAAFIDGANDWQVFFIIMLPQAKSAVLTMMIMESIGRWNDYMTPYLYLKNYPTMATGIFIFEHLGYAINRMPIYLAGLVILTAPIVVLFVCFNDQIMKNMSIGGLKG